MKKYMSSRTRAILHNCGLESNNEDKNNKDFYDDSRSSSPIHLSTGLLSSQRVNAVNVVLHEEINIVSNTNCAKREACFLDYNDIVETAGGGSLTKSIIFNDVSSPSTTDQHQHFSLTPKQLSDKITLTEMEAEKSIEPPPYSPLTPQPNTVKPNEVIGDELLGTDSSLNGCLAEKNIESMQNSLFSPLPPMSPDTAKIYHVLADSIEIDSFLETPRTSNMANLMDDENNAEISTFSNDDSARDPNYCTNDVDYDGSSDDSSNISVSLITSTTIAEINTLSSNRNDVLKNNLPLTHSDFRNVEHESGEIIELDIVPTEAVDGEYLIIASAEMGIADQSKNLPESDASNSRPKKGRKRLHGGLLREERKKCKYMNLPYVNARKKTVEPKKFVNFECSCSKKCHEKISVEKRLAAFNKFYSLGSYDAQNMFLLALIQETPVKRHYITNNKTNISKKKSYSRQYTLEGTLVCRDIFVQTFQTSAKRINTSLCKMRSENCITDRRGQQAGHNRVTPEDEQFVIDFIKRLPTYTSHYRREQSKDAKFLRPDMTLNKIYQLYSDEAKITGHKILSQSKVNSIFYSKFNLHTVPLKKDTCNKCDVFNIKKLHASEIERAEIEQIQKAHHDKAKKLQNQMKSDIKLASENPFVETITFDLEKTLPLPRIPTNIIFYKRQLWVYNLGIHAGSNDAAYCNVWVEGEAGRGAQEVGSCLTKYISEKVGGCVKQLILWSDSCGGQNRNIKMVLMLKALLNVHPTLEEIKMRFLESGHSFLPNDTDFSKIECALKRQQRIYTPEDYMEIMKGCKRNKMFVNKMKMEDFLSTTKLEKNITNRKKTVDGEKVSWLSTKEIMIRKEEMYIIYMRNDLDEEYKKINIKKNVRGRPNFQISMEIMEPLWPNGKPVPEAKVKDLKSILHLIPKDSHNFYVKLVGDSTIDDDLEGFSGNLDFEIEEVDNA